VTATPFDHIAWSVELWSVNMGNHCKHVNE